MGKQVGVAEFKAKCIQLMDEVNETGVTLTVTRRGKRLVDVKPAVEQQPKQLKSIYGLMKSDAYRFDIDSSEPAADPAEWDANNPAELYRRS